MPKKVHNSRTLKSYTLKEKDIRFLKAVDIIVKTNKEHNISPRNQSEVSLIISSDPSTISKIRRSQRGVTLEQIMTFCTYFHIDHNYFLSDNVEFRYVPRTQSAAMPAGYFSTYIDKIKDAMNECPPELKEKCFSMIEQMQEQIEKNCHEVQRLLSEARENEKDALRKYISLLEKLN